MGADDENNINSTAPALQPGLVLRDKWHVATIGWDAIIKLQFDFMLLFSRNVLAYI